MSSVGGRGIINDEYRWSDIFLPNTIIHDIYIISLLSSVHISFSSSRNFDCRVHVWSWICSSFYTNSRLLDVDTNAPSEVCSVIWNLSIIIRMSWLIIARGTTDASLRKAKPESGDGRDVARIQTMKIWRDARDARDMRVREIEEMLGGNLTMIGGGFRVFR